MRKVYHLILLCLLPLFSMAQIPNPDFELWQSMTKDFPQQWGIYGITKKVSGYNSPFAVRIERDPMNTNAPGAVIYGNPDQNFTGGIPFNDRPDSVVMFVKRHLPAGDSAWFLVVMSKAGQFISNNNFKFSGSDSTHFVRLAFAIHYSDTGYADSLTIGVSSTDPNSQLQGSFVIIDSIHFIGGKGIKVPNGNFELWQSVVVKNLTGWFSSNINGQSSAVTVPVTQTTDAALHQYAVRIQNVKDGPNYRQGYIMAGKQGNNGPLPGFSVNGKDSLLYAYYKCFPKNGDQINIGVMMFDSGQIVGTGFLRQASNITAWSQAPIKIDYFNGYTGVPDSAVIFCSAFDGGSDAKGESVLFVDALKFNEPMVSVSQILHSEGLLEVYPNPATGSFNISVPFFQGQNARIQIFDHQGKEVMNIPVAQEQNGRFIYTVSTSQLSKGIYTVSLQIGSNIAIKTLVVE